MGKSVSLSRWCNLNVLLVMLILNQPRQANGSIPLSTFRTISSINARGHYVGIVVPNRFEMNPLLVPNIFVPHPSRPYMDFSGRRFRFGTLSGRRVIVVMSGQSMLNAGMATELLLTLFRVKGVVHLGIAGNANPDFQIGDVTIPQYWAHSALWYWQRFGNGPGDELAYESSGDFTRELGSLRFLDFNNGTQTGETSSDNLLNYIWHQHEEVYPVNGTPEERQFAFWVPANKHYLTLAEKLEDMKLNKCVNNSTCLPRNPIVRVVNRGVSANIFVDNGAYRKFLYTKFNATPVDMESAAVALICLQQNTPFIAIRSLSDLAGGGSAVSNEASTFASLSAQNAADVVIQFIELLH